jgi:hypothetical protein
LHLVPGATLLATDYRPRWRDDAAFVVTRFGASRTEPVSFKGVEMNVSAKEAWLPAYLHDHLAGSVTAVDIARRRRDAETDDLPRRRLSCHPGRAGASGASAN